MHLFIDYTQLPQQSTNDSKFGPDNSQPTNKFNLTTQFNLQSEAKAFACQSGMAIVQTNSQYPSVLVNVILKPSKPTQINGYPVRYYIYRGLKFQYFLTNLGEVVPENESSSEFIQAFWRYREKVSMKTSIPDASPLDIGYGDNSIPPENPDSLNGLRPVRDIFNNKAPAKAFPVSEGMWLGDFAATTIGFDIELESELRLASNLTTCRANAIIFDTTSLTGNALKRRRELVRTYADPVAFLGLHSKDGIVTTTYTGLIRNPSVTKTIEKPATNFYSDVIEKFANRNRVYIDIKSDKGLSYNYYGRYKISAGDLSNIRLNGATQANAEVYEVNGWPILFFDTVINSNNIYITK